MTKLYPLMPLRDIIIFPSMVAPLVVGRKQSILALEDAMEKKTDILLVTQKKPTIDEPETDDLFDVGTLATVIQLLRLPDGTIKALVEGRARARIVSYVPSGDFLQVEAEVLEDKALDSVEIIAYERELQKYFKIFAASNKKITKEVVASIQNIDNPLKLLNVVCSHIGLKSFEKQEILEIDPLTARMEKVLEVLNREIELVELEKSINAKVKRRMLEETIKNKSMPQVAREKILKEFKKLKNMPPMSAETTVVRNYIDCLVNLPWDKKSKSKININKAEKILDEDHYGLAGPKERILEYLAVQTQVKKIKGPILCLVGPPGVGKTSICRSIARAMGRKFARLSLGGVRDEAEIRGHRRTYIGAMPGKIIQSIQKVGVSNPVFCLDEVDKMSMDFRGDPSSALLEVLDPEQNSAFNDHYLDVDYDLSEIFFITTANSLHGIPVPLQDRMEIIQLSGYTEEDKLEIAAGYLVPKQVRENGFKEDDIQLTDGAVLEVIRRYTREAGVRNLERFIASLCRKIARERLKKKQRNKKYRITVQSVSRFLGTPKYRYGLAEENDEIGVTTGLAWTEVGGELLQIEATLMKGSGKLIITGKLGDVMQESAQAALSYVRSSWRPNAAIYSMCLFQRIMKEI